MTFKIDPKKIRTDLQTQSRVTINESVVGEYAEAMQRGEQFPPVLVYYDDNLDEHILADGFHRYQAHMRVRQNEQIEVDQRRGTAENARWASLAANQSHGLQRSNADKRNAVKIALLHTNGASMSNRAIAKHVGVVHTTVRSIRRQLELSGAIQQIDSRTVTRNGTTYQQNTTNIGCQELRKSPKISQSDLQGKCGTCLNFSRSKCILVGEVKNPSTTGCEDYEERGEPVPRPEIPPPDYDNIQIVEQPEHNKPRRLNPCHYRRIKGAVKLYLPQDNPQLCAVELRNKFSEDYLCAIYTVLKDLWDDAENDNWNARMETHLSKGETVL